MIRHLGFVKLYKKAKAAKMDVSQVVNLLGVAFSMKRNIRLTNDVNDKGSLIYMVNILKMMRIKLTCSLN